MAQRIVCGFTLIENAISMMLLITLTLVLLHSATVITRLNEAAENKLLQFWQTHGFHEVAAEDLVLANPDLHNLKQDRVCYVDQDHDGISEKWQPEASLGVDDTFTLCKTEVQVIFRDDTYTFLLAQKQ